MYPENAKKKILIKRGGDSVIFVLNKSYISLLLRLIDKLFRTI